ncbi:MAG TPA: PKD domain-containing protein [Solirubrobacteraceae bacterium]|nr:PKD domain-containing protein [Solirubrobacteraceae bacterium]
MTTNARSHSFSGARVRLPRPRSISGLLAFAAASLFVLMLLLLAISASPAGAVVIEGEGVKVGLQPRLARPSLNANEEVQIGTPGASPGTFANKNARVVMHGADNYVVYWDPRHAYHHEWVTNVDTFFQQLGRAGFEAPVSELGLYRDRTNTGSPLSYELKGSYSDTAQYPTAGCTDPHALETGAVTCLTDAQLRTQLLAFISEHGLPKGMNTVYYVLTPPGVTVCLEKSATHCSDFQVTSEEAKHEERNSSSYHNSFCSYHGAINPDAAEEGDANTVLYAAIPWSVGLAGIAPGAYHASDTVYETGWDCQDSGVNPENHEEALEELLPYTPAQEKKLLGNKKEKAEGLLEHLLTGPHIQEPNQHEPNEEGDHSDGLSDVLVNQVSQELMDITTDPLLTSWQDTGGHELADICRNAFASTVGPEGGKIGGGVTANVHSEAGTLENAVLGGGQYYLNNFFNYGTGKCEGGTALVARFTSPDPVNANEIVAADGMESTVGLVTTEAFGPSGALGRTYSTYSWNFGDGTPEVVGFAPGAPPCEAPWISPCAGSAFHAYQYGGTYTITLSIKDVAGNTTSVSHPVTVIGPPAPGSAGSGSGSGAGSGATPGSGAGGHSGGSGSGAGIVGPVANAAVLSRSLRAAKKSGIVVAYSVNEQVAGHFEVLLSRTTAHRIGVTGSPATGLPAGSAASVVVAKAIIVTTRAGHSTVRLLLSKRNALRLARQRKVTFLLRLYVRNAAPRPATATMLSSFTLTH